MEKDPINNVEWIDSSKLDANNYNPNVCMNQELKLLEFSILKNGWIQPIIINGSNIIIDGFHRWKVSQSSAQLKAKYNGKIPVVVLPISDADAMLLTIRINRAKGSHLAFRMSEIIKTLVDKHNVDKQKIAQEIGAYKGEVDLLYADGVFKRKDIQNHKYSKAWEPKKQ